MGKRRKARELALQFLYSWDIAGGDPAEALVLFEVFTGENEDLPPYARTLIEATIEKKEELDGLIVRYCANWDLERIAAVDRNVLRLALCEMLYGEDIPPIVVINEAIDIAKKYSTVESGGFVNGILDRIRSELLPDEGGAGRKKEGE